MILELSEDASNAMLDMLANMLDGGSIELLAEDHLLAVLRLSDPAAFEAVGGEVEILVRAAAIGTRGQTGAAAAVLKGLSIASAGVVGTRGSGSGTIMKFEAAARGQHDEDEAAIVAWLLAA